MSGGATPSAAAAAAAASELLRLCSPLSASSPRRQSGARRPSSPATQSSSPSRPARSGSRPAPRAKKPRRPRPGIAPRAGVVTPDDAASGVAAPRVAAPCSISRSPTAGRPSRHAPFELRRHAGVVPVEQRQVALALVLEHAELGGHVAGVGRVAVEVVLGEVEEHGDTRPKALHVLHLERRHLGDDDRPRRRLAGDEGDGMADVAGDDHRETGARQDGAGQLGGRRLAVRAGDGDRRRVEEAIGELELAPDGHPARQRRPHDRALVGHPRALHQQVDALGKLRPRAEVEGDAGRAQLGRRRPELLLALGVERRDASRRPGGAPPGAPRRVPRSPAQGRRANGCRRGRSSHPLFVQRRLTDLGSPRRRCVLSRRAPQAGLPRAAARPGLATLRSWRSRWRSRCRP